MNKLKHFRKKAGLTQAELAAQAGISVRTLQDYEQGRKPLTGAAASTVLRMARILGLSLLSDVEELIGVDTTKERAHREANLLYLKGQLKAHEEWKAKHPRPKKTGGKG